MKDITTHLNEHIIFKGNLKRSPYKAVDLGLSVKWCSCNVGATKPEDPGLLFQWGKTNGYKYGDTNHKFLSKLEYNESTDIIYDNDGVLDSKCDAANVILKNGWRMPTRDELIELLSLRCEWTDLNGVKGYELMGENGNKIFLPITGIYNPNKDTFVKNDICGHIWASAMADNARAYDMYFNSASFDLECGMRFMARAIRPVIK